MAVRKKVAKPRPHVPTEAELANDHSLKFCPYRRWELLRSDGHGHPVRFLRYADDDHVIVASEHAIAELPGTFHVLTVRRPGG